MYKETSQIKDIIDKSKVVVVVQADNPDGDSLGSALALEQILSDQGKQVHLFCAVDIPSYLRYMSGWDRVVNELPTKFDSSIIIDVSTMTLLEKLDKSNQRSWIASKPTIVLDHHEVSSNPIPFASVVVNDFKRSSTGELIYLLIKELKWPLNQTAKVFLMSSILGDTQGLTNQLASAETYKIMAEMVESGVNRPELEEQRRELSKMPLDIYKYKGRLIERTEFSDDGKIALVTVDQSEINEYSALYNPAALVQADMLMTENVLVSIVLKFYDNGRLTGAIRANQAAPIAAKLAEHFGGGGHQFASGFKIDNSANLDEVKHSVFKEAADLIKEIA